MCNSSLAARTTCYLLIRPIIIKNMALRAKLIILLLPHVVEYSGVLRAAKFRDIYFGESPVPGLKGVITKKIAHS